MHAPKPHSPNEIRRILSILNRTYPEAGCALHYSNPLELLVATILSAQCTDALVNTVTPALFSKYPSASHYAQAPLSELEQALAKINFYKNKARFIQKACAQIVEQFHGRVPERMEDLIQLPGIGRKTANVILGNAFHKTEGIVVDTHVMRVSRRLGLTRRNDPIKIEQDLMRLIPRKAWISFAHQLILHGRSVCQARGPRCEECPLASLCCFAIEQTKIKKSEAL